MLLHPVISDAVCLFFFMIAVVLFSKLYLVRCIRMDVVVIERVNRIDEPVQLAQYMVS